MSLTDFKSRVSKVLLDVGSALNVSDKNPRSEGSTPKRKKSPKMKKIENSQSSQNADLSTDPLRGPFGGPTPMQPPSPKF